MNDILMRQKLLERLEKRDCVTRDRTERTHVFSVQAALWPDVVRKLLVGDGTSPLGSYLVHSLATRVYRSLPRGFVSKQRCRQFALASSVLGSRMVFARSMLVIPGLRGGGDSCVRLVCGKVGLHCAQSRRYRNMARTDDIATTALDAVVEPERSQAVELVAAPGNQ